MTPAEYNSWISNDDFNNSTISEPLITDIYQKFDDDFDFIFFDRTKINNFLLPNDNVNNLRE